MLQVSAIKKRTQNRMLTLSIDPSPIQSPKCPRTPAFSRKGGNNKRDKGMESLKSSGQRSVQKSLRYTKVIPQQWKNDDSEVQSEVHIIHMLAGKLEDSQETVIHRRRSQSSNKGAFLGLKNTKPKLKSPGRKILEDLGKVESKKSRLDHKTDQHYIYWKNKAYEYLQSNIKLMEEVRRLGRENEDLKSVIAKLQQNINSNTNDNENRIYSEKALSIQIRNISSIYISKIQSMEKELKRKEITIASYELKVKELSTQLAGDNDRIKLMYKLHEDIEAMKAQGWNHKIQPLKLESNYYASTSILPSESSNR